MRGAVGPGLKPKISSNEKGTPAMQPTDIKQLMAGKRHEPKTPAQWRQAEAGAAACDADWQAKEMPAFVDAGLRGADKHYRAAYELRYHEIIAANAGWLYGKVCVIDGTGIDPESGLCILSCQPADRAAWLAAGNPPYTEDELNPTS